jgi:hypothetical protein
MKKPIATAASLLVVPPFAVPWVCAQHIPMGFDVFAEFGPSCLHGQVHSGATGNAKCEAGRFFTGARLRLTRHDAIEASYSYSPNIFNEAYPLLYFNVRLSSHSINYVRYLSTNPHLQPFVTGGVGYEHFLGYRGVMPSSTSQFAWNYGAGIDVVLQRYFALRFDFREYSTSIPIYHTSTLHNFVPSIGIVFRFNRDRKL